MRDAWPMMLRSLSTRGARCGSNAIGHVALAPRCEYGEHAAMAWRGENAANTRYKQNENTS
eukprot:6120574-Lingulodinium_polyedra.AAC.1